MTWKQAWLLMAGSFVAGALIAVGFAFVRLGGPAEWIGFAGSIIGSLVTLLAATIAFGLTRKQVELQERELEFVRDQHRRQSKILRDLVFRMGVNLKASIVKIYEGAAEAASNGVVHTDFVRRIKEFRESIDQHGVWRLDRDLEFAIRKLDNNISVWNFRIQISEGDGNFIEMRHIEDDLRSMIIAVNNVIYKSSADGFDLTESKWSEIFEKVVDRYKASADHEAH